MIYRLFFFWKLILTRNKNFTVNGLSNLEQSLRKLLELNSISLDFH